MESIDYKDAGVDVDASDAFVEAIKPIVRKTFRPGTLSDIGGFGALFSLNQGDYKAPVLVSSTDGVGTKLKIAFLAGRHDTVGIDLVAMCANDIVVQGAEPLFFLDYMAVGKLDTAVATEIIHGIATGCKESGCALIGGETAEMPDMYPPAEYDLAGFCVGIVDMENLIDGSIISVQDAVIGIASSGLHANGYSLLRKLIFQHLKWKIDQYIPELGKPLGEELLMPTRIYVRTVLNLLKGFRIKGLAHITGGGLTDNLSRILPHGCQAVIQKNRWEPPPIFELIQEKGKVSEAEMFRVFNNGIGMAVVVEHEQAEEVMLRLQGLKEKAFVIGHIERRKKDDPSVTYV